MSSRKSLTEQAMYLIAGRCFAQVLTLLHPIILVRMFTIDEYGLYRQLLLIYATLLPFGQMGVTQGLYYFLPREPEKRDAVIIQTLVFVVILGSVVLGGLLLFQSSIAAVFHNAEMAQYLPLLAIHTFLMISSSFLETSMVAEGRSKLAAVVTVLSQLFHSTVLISAALFSKDILFIFYALVVFSGARFVFQSIYFHKKYSLSIKRFDFRFLKRQLAYSIPIGLGNVSWLLQTKLHNYFVSFFFNPSMFALYSIGTFNIPIVGIITSSAANVMTPELSRCQKEGRRSDILKIWNNAIRKMNLLILPTFIFFEVMAPEFIRALFTESYVASAPIFRISLLGLLIAGINTGAILSAHAETKYLMRIAFLRISVAIPILYIFTSIWGVLGAISADIVTSLSFRLLVLTKVASVLEISFWKIIQWKINAKIFWISAIPGLLLFFLKDILSVPPLVCLITAFLLYFSCYGLLVSALGVISKNERVVLKDYILQKLGLSKKHG